MKVNSVNLLNSQNLNRNNNYLFYTENVPKDSVCFKAKHFSKKNKSVMIKILKLFGISTATAATGNKILSEKSEKTEKNKIDEWNSECTGYKALQKAGFSGDLIDKTFSKMPITEAEILKQGLNTKYIKCSDEMISGIYNRFNKDLQDDEKSAEITFSLLSEIFKRSKDSRIYLYGVNSAVKIYGIEVFEKGTLNDGGTFGDNFVFIDKDGHNIADRVQVRTDSDGNKIVESIDSDGKVKNKGKKYDPMNKLLEEWSDYERTEYHYDKYGNLFEKVKHYSSQWNSCTETFRRINGEWKSDKDGGWKDW